jgi:photosystem II stability/assembly factor-like uncharacterized protein
MSAVNAMVIDNGVLLAGTSSGFFTSTDSGSTWTASNNGMPNSYGEITSLASEDSIVYAGVSLGGVYKSTDFGLHWAQMNAGLTSGNVGHVCAHGNLVFAGTSSQGAFRSTDGGISWDSIDSGLPSGGVGSILFFGTKTFTSVYSEFCESNDSGAHWSARLSLVLPAFINTFLAIGSTIYAGNAGLNKSTDTGASWTPFTYESMLGNGILSIANFDAELFIGTMEGNVLVSIDSGANWLNISSNLPDMSINSLAVADGSLFAANPLGIWRAPLSSLLTASVAAEHPPSFFLSIFPNPSSTQSTIDFTLPEREYISLALYDELGVERARMFEGELDAGAHSIQFANSALADGAYDVVLRTAINRAATHLLIQR